MTTFTSRELVRDELVSKFVANGAWQNVYGYRPAIKEILGKTPFLVIVSQGRATRFETQSVSPTIYRFQLFNFVLAYSENPADNYSSNDAEDALDTLDKTITQIIWDNRGDMTTANVLSLDDGGSERTDLTPEGVPYIRERYTILAFLAKGAI